MKKIIFLFTCLLLTNYGFSQTKQIDFAINRQGVCYDSLTSKDYIVIEKNGPQKELYDKMLNAVHLSFNSPTNVLSTIPEQRITLTYSIPFNIKVPGGLGAVWEGNLLMHLSFAFKDNKIQIKSYIVSMHGDSFFQNTRKGHGIFPVWDKNDNIVNYKKYMRIKNEINNSISSILATFLKTENTENNW